MRQFQFVTVKRIEVVLLALGVLLRVVDFLRVRSLWLDEAMLARNIIDRSPLEFFRPLDHDQAAPVGFLLLQKLVISLFGTSECAFRLIPSLLGIWALFLFARLSQRIVGPKAALFVLPMFVSNSYFVWATNKQYPVDVWAVLLLVNLIWRVAEPTPRRRDFVLLAFVGACLVWIAHPVSLVAAGLGTPVILSFLWNRQWRRAGLMLVTVGCWLTSFAVVYWLSLRHVHSNEYLVNYWKRGFPPEEGGIMAFLKWVGVVLADSFNVPSRISPKQLGIPLVVFGIACLVRKPHRFGLLVLPIGVVFGASIARVFPFQYRLVMFLVPFLLWLLATSLSTLVEARWRVVRIVGWLSLTTLVWHPILDVKRGFLNSARFEESRVVLEYLASHAEPGDILFVHLNTEHTFAYYRTQIDLSGLEVVHGAAVPPPEAGRQFGELPANRRVWLFHSGLVNAACPVEPIPLNELISYANRSRPTLDRHDAPGVCVVLFGPENIPKE